MDRCRMRARKRALAAAAVLRLSLLCRSLSSSAATPESEVPQVGRLWRSSRSCSRRPLVAGRTSELARARGGARRRTEGADRARASTQSRRAARLCLRRQSAAGGRDARPRSPTLYAPGPKLCSFLGDKESRESNWVSQPAVCLPRARARTLRHETTPSLPQSITTRMSC
eukprot:4393104-Prymnesium_polylepis.2